MIKKMVCDNPELRNVEIKALEHLKEAIVDIREAKIEMAKYCTAMSRVNGLTEEMGLEFTKEDIIRQALLISASNVIADDLNHVMKGMGLIQSTMGISGDEFQEDLKRAGAEIHVLEVTDNESEMYN